jgi:hypothetical protein
MRMRLSSIAKSKLVLLLLTGVVALPCAARVQEKSDPDYEREELGVNSYTTPSIARIFQQLDELKPLPFNELKREPAAVTHASREQLGLAFGGLIADGFLIVAAEKNDLVDDLGRSLLKEAKSLGVAERVIRHSKSLTELGRRSDWTAVRQELTATQTDVEEAMIELRDQKMAHLISLGGWLRGLEIIAGTVMAEFSFARAKILSQPDLLNYFSEALETLPPDLRQVPLFTKIRAGVTAIRSRLITNSSSLTAADVRMVHDEAHALNIAIQQSDDSKPEP